MPATETGDPTSSAGENRLLAAIPRYRWAFFALVGLLVILTFNGQWRIGRDSAAYRGLAHHLATTGKYIFRDKPPGMPNLSEEQDTRYPGLPVMLAGVERLTGRGDAPAIILVLLTGIVTLFLTYRLMRPVVPPWVAVAVTFNLGINARFLEHANEVLTDVPSLMGIMLAMLAFDRLLKANQPRPRALWAITLMLAMLFSAALRPTFWIFAAALVVTCVVGLFATIVRRPDGTDPAPQRTSRRLACAITLGAIALATGVFILALDMRGGSKSKYEGRMLGKLNEFEDKIIAPLRVNLHETFESTLPEAFLGTQLSPGFVPLLGFKWGLSTVFSLALIAASVALLWRHVLWGTFLLATIFGLAPLGTVPRYFVMILPLLLVAWMMGVAWLAGRCKAPGVRWTVVLLGLGIVAIPNFVASLDLVREQRGIGKGKQGLRYVGFEQSYHSGKWAGIRELAGMIRAKTKPGDRVIGPESTVLTYLSDRSVYRMGMLMTRKEEDWPRRLRFLSKRVPYALFPTTLPTAAGDKVEPASRFFDDKDGLTWGIIKLGLIKPRRALAAIDGYALSTYTITPVGSAATTQPKRRRYDPRRRRRPPPRATPRRPIRDPRHPAPPKIPASVGAPTRGDNPANDPSRIAQHAVT